MWVLNPLKKAFMAELFAHESSLNFFWSEGTKRESPELPDRAEISRYWDERSVESGVISLKVTTSDMLRRSS
jgi:hypothetical protein